MKILFVYPNLGCQIGFNYGLAHIASVLKAHGHAVSLMNVNEKLGFPFDAERIRQETRRAAPDLVGFSVVTNQFANALQIAGIMREVTKAPFVCGGVHATMAPEEVLASGVFDFACVGEGELAMLDLVGALERKEEPTKIANIWTRRNGKLIRNPVRPFVDLRELPRKDYEIFDFQKMIDAKDGWVGLMATRGCPYRCAYCFNHAMVQLYQRDTGLRGAKLGYIRQHPASEVIDEIGALLARYTNIRTFIFDDDVFTLDKRYLMEFCRAYAERFSVPFVCNAHVRVFDAEVANTLASAGCRMVKFGLESGSPRVRAKVLFRHMSNDQIAAAFAAAHAAGLQTSAFVMIGLPDESMADLDMTLQLLGRIRPTRFRWSIFFPFPGTRLYTFAAEKGLVDEQKMATQTNFMDDTCLRFEPNQVAFIHKLRRFFPWFVNAKLSDELGERFHRLIERIVRAREDELDALEAEGNVLCQELQWRSVPHYVVKYNRFMAVRTDMPEV